MSTNQASISIKELSDGTFKVTVSRYGIVREGVVPTMSKAIRAVEAAWQGLYERMLAGEL